MSDILKIRRSYQCGNDACDLGWTVIHKRSNIAEVRDESYADLICAMELEDREKARFFYDSLMQPEGKEAEHDSCYYFRVREGSYGWGVRCEETDTIVALTNDKYYVGLMAAMLSGDEKNAQLFFRSLTGSYRPSSSRRLLMPTASGEVDQDLWGHDLTRNGVEIGIFEDMREWQEASMRRFNEKGMKKYLEEDGIPD